MLSLAVGYQLKCCYGSRRSNAWCNSQSSMKQKLTSGTNGSGPVWKPTEGT